MVELNDHESGVNRCLWNVPSKPDECTLFSAASETFSRYRPHIRTQISLNKYRETDSDPAFHLTVWITAGYRQPKKRQRTHSFMRTKQHTSEQIGCGSTPRRKNFKFLELNENENNKSKPMITMKAALSGTCTLLTAYIRKFERSHVISLTMLTEALEKLEYWTSQKK